MNDVPDSVPSRSPGGLISRSHLGIEPFELHRPSSLAETASAIASGAWAYAGGVDVTQRLRGGEVAQALVPLCRPGRGPSNGLEQLDEISIRDGALFIGAAVTHARIESDPLVRKHRPDLAAAWLTIGNIRIRAVGTVGGNLMSFNTLNDAAPILAAASAVLVFAEPDGSFHRCALGNRPADRLLIGCEVPLDGHVVYDRSNKPAVSVAVGDNAIAIGCAYPDIGVIGFGATDPDAVRVALDELAAPVGDLVASAAYRRHVIGVLVERGLRSHARGDGGSNRPTAEESTNPDTLAADIPPPDGTVDPIDATGPVSTASAANVRLRLNGEPFEIDAPVSEMLVDTIGSRAGLGGTRVGCDQAVCGSCTVLLDGAPAASCSTFSWQADGRDVYTIELASAADIASDDAGPIAALRAVQQAFADISAFQCGYCTPGMILTASALIDAHPQPDRRTICDWLNSNYCRCTGYLMIIEAVEAAAAALHNVGTAAVTSDLGATVAAAGRSS